MAESLGWQQATDEAVKVSWLAWGGCARACELRTNLYACDALDLARAEKLNAVLLTAAARLAMGSGHVVPSRC